MHRGPWLQGSEIGWAIAFAVTYAAVFLCLAAYPIAYRLWMGREPSPYAELLADPRYGRALVNTLLFVGLAVSLKLFIALLLSGFFQRTACCWRCSPSMGPIWFNDRGLALGSNIVAYIWKWMPFWTMVFLAALMAIPPEIYEAAAVDGATGPRRFVHVTFPLLANVYLVSTVLSTIWTLGDFTVVQFVSGGAPAMSSDVVATLGVRFAFDHARPQLGVAAMISALPVLIALVVVLLRALHMRELQL